MMKLWYQSIRISVPKSNNLHRRVFYYEVFNVYEFIQVCLGACMFRALNELKSDIVVDKRLDTTSTASYSKKPISVHWLNCNFFKSAASSVWKRGKNNTTVFTLSAQLIRVSKYQCKTKPMGLRYACLLPVIF